jgi:pimeloyl-ACP methyl ester carboxylesterase
VSRGLRRLALATGGATVGVAAAVAGERYLVRRGRSRPDAERGERLGERPGTTMRVRSFDGTELEVGVVGPTVGPTLVFSHGFSGDMTTWHYQWKHFAGRYRCVLYDHRGHGRSESATEGDYSLRALGCDLRAVLDATVSEGSAVLFGHSMGGMAIMALAESNPEEFGGRVRAAVLADTSASDLVREIVSGLGARASAFLARQAARLAGRAPASRLRARVMARRSGLAFLVAEASNFGPHASPSLIDHVVSVAAEARPEVWSRLMASLMDMNLTEALTNIAVPSLVIVGDVDRLTPPLAAEAMARRLPDPKVVVLEGAGHCAMLERHAQFNAVVERFLEDHLPPRRPGGRAAGSAPARAGRST